MNPLAAIKTEELTHQLWLKSRAQAEVEREWAIVENQRLPVLAEITGWYEGSHTASEAKARVSREYQEFLTRMGEVKARLIEARNKTKAVDLEIRLRINKGYTDRAEYQGGKLNP
jgi:hypothetical protein